MHNLTYASGFIYHPPSDQILLQNQTSETAQSWSLLSIKTAPGDSMVKSFASLLKKVLHVSVNQQKIHEVYDYSKDKDTQYKVFYAEVDKIINIPKASKDAFSWFSRKQIAKLPLDMQLKQDVIVSLRVIDANHRKSQGLQTLE